MMDRIALPRGLLPPGVSSLFKRTAAMLMVALSLGAGEPAGPKTPETAVVSYRLAPGEVGSSVESITVARRGAERTITLTQERPKQKPRTETLPLKPEEFDKVWSIVTGNKLLEFTPDEQPGDAPDYGDETLRTEVREKAGDPPRIRESRWDRPIRNESRLSPLVLELARLARARGKQVKLELFVP